MQEEKDGPVEKKKYMWRNSIILGLQFLTIPITIDFAERDANLRDNRVTNLWRFMSNLFMEANIADEQPELMSEEHRMQSYMMSDTIDPVYNDEIARFDFFLEVPRNNETIQEAIHRRNKHKGEVAGEEDLEKIMSTYMLVYAKPVFSKDLMVDVRDMNEEDMYKRRLNIARSLLASANMMSMEDISSERAQRFVQEVFNKMGINSKNIGG